VIFDAARIGPDYLPGHAHADTLSLEMSLGAERVIVNGGTSCYGKDAERLRQRGTAAHSTVIVDGLDSSEVWSGFRVARRACPFDLRVGEMAQEVVVECSHDGYRRLKGRPVHRRQWRLGNDQLTVEDWILPADGHRATARFLLHPTAMFQRTGPNAGQLELASGRKIQVQSGEAELRIEEATWAPRFGERIATHGLTIDLRDGRSGLTLTW
jgi:uncharacterized heparinase superfamily protein